MIVAVVSAEERGRAVVIAIRGAPRDREGDLAERRVPLDARATDASSPSDGRRAPSRRRARRASPGRTRRAGRTGATRGRSKRRARRARSTRDRPRGADRARSASRRRRCRERPSTRRCRRRARPTRPRRPRRSPRETPSPSDRRATALTSAPCASARRNGRRSESATAPIAMAAATPATASAAPDASGAPRASGARATCAITTHHGPRQTSRAARTRRSASGA